MATLDFGVPASSDVVYEHSTLDQIFQRIDTLTLKDSIAYLQNELRDGHLSVSEVEQVYVKIRNQLKDFLDKPQEFKQIIKLILQDIDRNLAVTTHYSIPRIINLDILKSINIILHSDVELTMLLHSYEQELIYIRSLIPLES